MSEAVQVELIHSVLTFLGLVISALGVAWISSRQPKKILEKVEEVHQLTNSTNERQEKKIDALTALVSELKTTAAYNLGVKDGKEGQR